MLPEDYKTIKITSRLRKIMKKIEKEIEKSGSSLDHWEFQERPTKRTTNGKMIVLLCSFGAGVPRFYGEWSARIFWQKAKEITWKDFESFHEKIREQENWDMHSQYMLESLERYLSF